MNTTIIDATKNTPEVIFDIENKTLSLKGKSLPEDSEKFYVNVNEIFENFLTEINYTGLIIICDLSYVNSSSSKRIYNIFKMSMKMVCNPDIIWRYDVDDDDVKEQGEEYRMALGSRVNFIFESHKQD